MRKCATRGDEKHFIVFTASYSVCQMPPALADKSTTMRIVLPIIAFLTAGLMTGCREKTAEPSVPAPKAAAPAPTPASVENPIVSFYFVGGNQLKGNTNAANL